VAAATTTERNGHYHAITTVERHLKHCATTARPHHCK
jgi:hypothetical protein